MKRLLLVFFIAILLIGSQFSTASRASASASALAQDSWGALAFSDSTHKFGWSVNYDSEKGASQRALSECPSDDCQIVLTFANSCGAYASSADDDHWGWAIGDDREEAEAKALAQCRKRGDGCKIRVWGCSRGN